MAKSTLTRKNTPNHKPKKIKQASGDFVHQAGQTAHALAQDAKTLVCQKGGHAWMFIKSHPAQATGVLLAGLGLMAWAKQRNTPKGYTHNHLIEPVVDGVQKTKDALSHFLKSY